MSSSTFSPLLPRSTESLSTEELYRGIEASRSLRAYLDAAESPQWSRETSLREENERWYRALNLELAIRDADRARFARSSNALARAA